MRIFDWLFKKQSKPTGHHGSYTGYAAPKAAQETYLVTFEQMRKGAINRRGRKDVRQCVVMVGSDLRLVTSGDRVPRDTYLAMCKLGYLDLPKEERDAVLETAKDHDIIEAPLPPAEAEPEEAEDDDDDEVREEPE